MATYSLRIDGERRLSGNFQVKEFACRDGSDLLLVDEGLVLLLQGIRDHFGRPVIVKSGYRTAQYNQRCGGAKASRHMQGTAADIRIEGVDPGRIAAFAETLLGSGGGIGCYHGRFAHVDVREERARWKQLRPGAKYISVRSF